METVLLIVLTSVLGFIFIDNITRHKCKKGMMIVNISLIFTVVLMCGYFNHYYLTFAMIVVFIIYGIYDGSNLAWKFSKKRRYI